MVGSFDRPEPASDLREGQYAATVNRVAAHWMMRVAQTCSNHVTLRFRLRRRPDHDGDEGIATADSRSLQIPSHATAVTDILITKRASEIMFLSQDDSVMNNNYEYRDEQQERIQRVRH
jgi:hypothetical protein